MQKHSRLRGKGKCCMYVFTISGKSNMLPLRRKKCMKYGIVRSCHRLSLVPTTNNKITDRFSYAHESYYIIYFLEDHHHQHTVSNWKCIIILYCIIIIVVTSFFTRWERLGSFHEGSGHGWLVFTSFASFTINK